MCPVSEPSCLRNVLSVSCPVGELSVGELSVAELSIGEVSLYLSLRFYKHTNCIKCSQMEFYGVNPLGKPYQHLM